MLDCGKRLKAGAFKKGAIFLKFKEGEPLAIKRPTGVNHRGFQTIEFNRCQRTFHYEENISAQ